MPYLGNFWETPNKWRGGEQQEDTVLARLECKSMEGWKFLPVVSSDCMGEDIKRCTSPVTDIDGC